MSHGGVTMSSQQTKTEEMFVLSPASLHMIHVGCQAEVGGLEEIREMKVNKFM